MELIALSGYSRVGKDSVADFLVEQRGFERISFAAKLKQAVRLLNPPIGVDLDGDLLYLGDFSREGEDFIKASFPQYRRLLQRMGNEVGRGLFGENFWVDQTLKDLDDNGKYVISDCRYPNEADAIKSLGGKIIRISRPGYSSVNNHISEVALDDYLDFDGYIVNDGDLHSLRQKVKWLL